MPVFHQIDQTTAVGTSLGGQKIKRELNTHYGYWATSRFLTDAEADELMKQPAYDGPLHPAEVAYRKALVNSCD